MAFFSLNTYSEKEIPGPTFNPIQGNHRQLYHLGVMDFQTQWGQWKTSDQLFWRYDDQRLSNVPPWLFGFGNARSRALSVGAKARFTHLWKNGNTLAFLAGAKMDRYQVDSAAHPQDKTQKWRWSFPLALHSKIYGAYPNWTIQPALLAHYYDYALKGESSFDATAFVGSRAQSYFLLSPRLSTLWRPTRGLELRGAVGSYYRAPSMYELFGAPVGVSPSQGLTYERALRGDVEVAGLWEPRRTWSRNVRAAYVVSHSRATNLITYTQNSQQSQTAINIGKSEIWMHEASVENQTRFGFKQKIGATWTRSRNTSEVSFYRGRELPHRPSLRYFLSLGWRWRAAGLGVDYLLEHSGTRYWDVANLKTMAPVTLHSVFLNWKTQDYGSLGIEIRNLTDETTASSSFRSYTGEILDNTTGYAGFPAPGRRISFSWKIAI